MTQNSLKKRAAKIKLAAVALFFVLMAIGLNQAYNKYLWGDEVYTQINVGRRSYLSILQGMQSEGNNCPLFYLVQKMMLDVMRYKTPESMIDNWDHQRRFSWDQGAMVFTRINPNLFMSLSMVLVFAYFAYYSSWWMGLYSLFLFLSSHMIWMYWAEARPYGLWVFLTVLQSLAFLSIMREKEPRASRYRWLAAAHIGLGTIASLGMFQIAIVSLLLWVLKTRDWKRYIFVTGVPIALGLYYFSISSANPFGQSPIRVDAGFFQVFLPVFSPQRMLIVGIYAAFLILRFFKTKGLKRDVVKSGSYLALTVLTIISAVVIYTIYVFRSSPPGTGAPLSSRLFMFATPVSIIATVYFLDDLIKAFQGRWWIQATFVVGFVGLNVIGFFKNCYWLIGIF